MFEPTTGRFDTSQMSVRYLPMALLTGDNVGACEPTRIV